jgi:hypothetical protein
MCVVFIISHVYHILLIDFNLEFYVVYAVFALHTIHNKLCLALIL